MNAKEKTARRPAGHYVLEVRARAAQVAWLEASPTWTDSGRVGYKTGQAVFVPGPADLARAEYQLNSLRRYPVSAAHAFGDAEAWQARMRAKLAQAKLLLRAPDDPRACLLAAALCPGRPPVELSLPAAEDVPGEARALADLLRRPGGPPPHPHLIAALPAFEERLVSAWRRAPELPLPLVVDLPRRLRAREVAPERVVALVEALTAQVPGMLRALEVRAQMPARRKRRRSRTEDRDAGATLRDSLLWAWLDAADGDPALVQGLARFVDSQLARFPGILCLDQLVVQPLAAGRKRLAPERLGAFLDFLEAAAEALWMTPEALAQAAGLEKLPPGDARFWAAALGARIEGVLRPAIDLLERVGGDVAVAAELVRREGGFLQVADAAAGRRTLQLLDLIATAPDFDERELLAAVCGDETLFRALCRCLSGLSPAARRTLWQGLAWALEEPRLAQKVARTLTRGRELGALAERIAAGGADAGVLGVPIEAALSDDPLAFPTICRIVEGMPSFAEEGSWDFGQRLRAALAVAHALAPGDPIAYAAIVEAVRRHPSLDGWWVSDTVQKAAPALATLAGLTEALRAGVVVDAGRALQVMVRLRFLQPFLRDAAVAAPLNALNDATDAPHGEPEWGALLALDPALAPLAGAFVRAQHLLGAPAAVPAGVRRFALEREARLTREREYLRTLPTDDPRRARLARVEALLLDEARLRRRAADEARERLTVQVGAASLAAAERQVRRAIQGRLEAVIGPLPAARPFDDDLANAAILLATISQNRRLLIRLLRAASARREREFVARHPANRRFLAGLAARGVAVERWLSEARRTVRIAGVGRCTLWLSRDPIAILQMGNYFGTCLSAGDINAFSTVANACELNKRVLFVRDSAGRIVARKLLGIDAQGRLLGFRTYAAGQDEARAQALREAVGAYVQAFAAACGLERADNGAVPALFAQAWYDDGAVAWSERDAAAGKIKP